MIYHPWSQGLDPLVESIDRWRRLQLQHENRDPPSEHNVGETQEPE